MNDQHQCWVSLYPAHVDPDLERRLGATCTLVSEWRKRVAENPDAIAMRYFNESWTVSRVDELSDATASFFEEKGVKAGDKVGVQLQNVPQFAWCMVALWKLGAVPLILNTMYGTRELTTILSDARPVGLVTSEVDARVIDGLELPGHTPWVMTTDDDDLEALSSASSVCEADDGLGLGRAVAAHIGRTVSSFVPSPEHPALLTYTSGTTGPPKGAVGTHRNLLSVGLGVQQWLDLRPGDGVLAVAPLFHITGAVATAATALTVARADLIFVGRTRPAAMVEAIRQHDVRHLLGSITVYNALLDYEGLTRDDLAHLKTVYSGGAPVPPATVEKFEYRFGHYIHNIYGMTETASAVVAVPLGQRAPVDSSTGTLAIGVPLPGMDARVVDIEGKAVEPGVMGELVLKGPQCTAEYLNKPDDTAATIREGWLHTGDVAVMDLAGWIYLVDRQKDQINVSGYKVWPREVEDVIYEHPGVSEVAVVGLPDSYAGERVTAFVSLQSGAEVNAEDIGGLVKQRLARFKVPKDIYLIDELPKTPTGKIQRRVLRDAAANVTAEG